jgi:hypothetical protein
MSTASVRGTLIVESVCKAIGFAILCSAPDILSDDAALKVSRRKKTIEVS